MYFAKFPRILYPFEINGKLTAKLITDVTINVRIVKEILQNITVYDEYDIQDGETPEIISEKVYGSPLYHWVIMVINERFDYLNDWPMEQFALDEYITNKYGETKYDTHHYVDSNGFIVNSNNVNLQDEFDATTVTNYDYELEVNESKRRIKIISQEILFRILAQYNTLV